MTNLAGLPETEGLAGTRNFRAEAGPVPGSLGLEAGDPAFPPVPSTPETGEESVRG